MYVHRIQMFRHCLCTIGWCRSYVFVYTIVILNNEQPLKKLFQTKEEINSDSEWYYRYYISTNSYRKYFTGIYLNKATYNWLTH